MTLIRMKYAAHVHSIYFLEINFTFNIEDGLISLRGFICRSEPLCSYFFAVRVLFQFWLPLTQLLYTSVFVYINSFPNVLCCLAFESPHFTSQLSYSLEIASPLVFQCPQFWATYTNMCRIQVSSLFYVKPVVFSLRIQLFRWSPTWWHIHMYRTASATASRVSASTGCSYRLLK